LRSLPIARRQLMRRSTLFVFAIAFGSTAVVALLNFSLHPYMHRERPLLLLAAVMFSAWLGGMKAGLVATGVAAAVDQYMFIPPYYSFRVPDVQTLAQTVLFIVEGGLISAMAGRLHAETERAQEAIHERDEFLAVASHELKNPITTLRAALGSMQVPGSGSSNANDAQRLLVARRQVERVGRLLDDLLQIGRLASGSLQIEREEVDLGELTRSVVAVMEPEANRAGSTLCLRVDGTVVARCDRVRVEQVVMNLISNAIKYGRGQPVDVELARVGDHARLVVADRGIGIPEDQKARVFERFRRAPGAIANNIEGMGIGLWVVREIVDKHGGRIELESRPGVGSTFVVDLPLGR
jgi:signal transduction histidine kinase